MIDSNFGIDSLCNKTDFVQPGSDMKQHHQQHFEEEESDSDTPPEELNGRMPNDGSDEEGPSSSGRSHSSSEEGATDEDSDDLDAQEQILEQRLAEVPLEAVINQVKDGKGPTPAAARAAAVAAKQQVFHRETKNRPQQLSSKRPVSRFREVIQIPKQ